MKQVIITILTLTTIIGVIVYLELQKPTISHVDLSESKIVTMNPQEEKEIKYEKAREIVQPSGFLNTQPIKISDYIGKNVILVDFMTYSCINCQRTFPYLNAWWEKYQDEGLIIIGIHTPEFEFEQKKENVQQALEKFGIHFPVVLDNDYGTWRAYGNRYWPRKYLIDIDGYIVYDHIGEGAYEETEQKIQELLQERKQRLGSPEMVSSGTVQPSNIETVQSGKTRTPEIYFGSHRNDFLSNGVTGMSQQRIFTKPAETPLNHFALDGTWDIQSEYAENTTKNSRIILQYRAQKVFFVAGSQKANLVQVLLDGKPIEMQKGSDVSDQGFINVQAEGLYRLVEDTSISTHTLELIISDPGLQAFTFTFG